MPASWSRTLVLIAAIVSGSPAHGQEATDRYIPLGRSPGISGTLTSIGEIVEVDPRERTMTIAEAAGRRTVKITDKTRIWIDRSKLKLTNVTGSFADLEKGRRVEAKYLDPTDRHVADWVKVEAKQP
jgi:hypothetical protein